MFVCIQHVCKQSLIYLLAKQIFRALSPNNKAAPTNSTDGWCSIGTRQKRAKNYSTVFTVHEESV